MPIFEFICDTCGKTEDRLIRRDDIDNQKCTCPDAAKMQKSDHIQNTSFSLKGIWYKTHKSY